MKVKVKDLKDGTLFYVNNGAWTGYITTEDGQKICYAGVNTKCPTEEFTNRFIVNDTYDLDVDILSGGLMKNYEFNAERTKNELVSWIRTWFHNNGKGCNAVLGISGGKDSTIAAALCVEALGKDRVIGVLLPNGEQADIMDSYEVCDILGIRSYVMDISEGVNATYKQMQKCGLEITQQVRENTPPMERTKCIRSVCRSQNGRMVNTCNYSEDFIGYFTIGGDGDGDFAPLGGLTKTEVVSIGYCLGLPTNLIEKAPSDGLCGKTDEDNFGFSYKDLDAYITEGTCGNSITDTKIKAKHDANAFKLKPIPTFKPNFH